MEDHLRAILQTSHMPRFMATDSFSLVASLVKPSPFHIHANTSARPVSPLFQYDRNNLVAVVPVLIPESLSTLSAPSSARLPGRSPPASHATMMMLRSSAQVGSGVGIAATFASTTSPAGGPVASVAALVAAAADPLSGSPLSFPRPIGPGPDHGHGHGVNGAWSTLSQSSAGVAVATTTTPLVAYRPHLHANNDTMSNGTPAPVAGATTAAPLASLAVTSSLNTSPLRLRAPILLHANSHGGSIGIQPISPGPSRPFPITNHSSGSNNNNNNHHGLARNSDSSGDDYQRHPHQQHHLSGGSSGHPFGITHGGKSSGSDVFSPVGGSPPNVTSPSPLLNTVLSPPQSILIKPSA
jgi:hypothetical protein